VTGPTQDEHHGEQLHRARTAVAVPSQMTAKEMMEAIGWTKADQRQAERLNEIERLGGWGR
jgi:hypothetical protein